MVFVTESVTRHFVYVMIFLLCKYTTLMGVV